MNIILREQEWVWAYELLYVFFPFEIGVHFIIAIGLSTGYSYMIDADVKYLLQVFELESFLLISFFYNDEMAVSNDVAVSRHSSIFAGGCALLFHSFLY